MALPGDPRTWLLHERRIPGKAESLIVLMTPAGGEVWGWARKASRTEGPG